MVGSTSGKVGVQFFLLGEVRADPLVLRGRLPVLILRYIDGFFFIKKNKYWY